MTEALRDAIAIGAGQAGLAVAHSLRRAKLGFVLLDPEAEPGGAWPRGWNSLRPFFPAGCSPLPGWPMPDGGAGGNPTRNHALDSLRRYQERCDFPIARPVRIETIEAIDGHMTASDGGRDGLDGPWPARRAPGRHRSLRAILLVSTILVALGLGAASMEQPVLAAALVLHGSGLGIMSIARGAVPFDVFGPGGYATVMGLTALPSLLAQAAAPPLPAFFMEARGAVRARP